MKSKLETGITIASVIASMTGMTIISIKTWQFISEHLDETIQLFVKLF